MSAEAIFTYINEYKAIVPFLSIFVYLLWSAIYVWLQISLNSHREYGKLKTIALFSRQCFILCCYLLGLFFITAYAARLESYYDAHLFTAIAGIFEIFNPYIIALVLISGFITYYFFKERVRESVAQEKNAEIKAETLRKNLYDQKFKHLLNLAIEDSSLRGSLKRAGVWLLKKVLLIGRWFYKEGWQFILLLLFIMLFFTAVKYPFFDRSFTGTHTMKYNTHVEPARYMAERNDIFWYQQKYRADPVRNPQGIRSNFNSLPIIEWGLFATFKLFPQNSLEFNARFFTHLQGLLILLLAYLFFSRWFSKKQSILITFLIAINPIISFITFVTVEDGLLLIFTFLALLSLTNYIKEGNIRGLYWSGIFFGLGSANKISIILWLAPLLFIVLAFNSKKVSTFIRDYGLVILLSLLSIVVFSTSLQNLPGETGLALFYFLIWVAVFYGLYRLIIKYQHGIDKLITHVIKTKSLLVASCAVFVLAGIFTYYHLSNSRYAEEFLTDANLIFYWDMYMHMLNNQFKIYMTSNIFYLGSAGFVVTLFWGNREQRILMLSFLSGSFIYWVLASKPMFFHVYYSGIIMITFTLSVGILFYLLSKIVAGKVFSCYIFVFLLLAVLPQSITSNVGRLSLERANLDDLKKVAQFLVDNTTEEEIYLDDNYLLSLTLMSDRPRTEDYYLETRVIKASIKEIGFAGTMEKYNISYLVTDREHPRYEGYINLFTDLELAEVAYRRSDIIRSSLSEDYQYFPDQALREALIEAVGLKEKFVLVEKHGPYRIYGFED